MRSKTIALFLALGMASSITACAQSEAPEGGETEATPGVEEINPAVPEATPGAEGTETPEGTEGGEGGEG